MRNIVMRNIKTIFILTFYVIMNFTLECNAYDGVNFSNITIDDGLPQATVETMIQDSKGYIWIGTNDGLSRYNGYKFKNFREEKGHKNSLVNNYIVDLAEDEEGNIWILTIKGVSKINNSGETITNYFSSEEEGNLSHYNTTEILCLSNGDILIGTMGGIDIYDKTTDSFMPFVEKDKLTNDEVYSLSEDAYGNIWVGTTDGLNMIKKDSREVIQYNSDGTENTIPDDVIYKVYSDVNDVIWLGTYSKGAIKFNTKTGEIIRYNGDSWNLGENPGEHIRDFYRDSNGVLWISTSVGLIKCIENDKFTIYKNKVYDKRSLVDSSIFTVMEDNSGMLWVGTYAGISTFDPTNSIKHYKNDPSDKTTLNGNMIQGLYEDEEGFLWVGTNANGVNILDKNRDKIDEITTNTSKMLSSDRINDIAGYKNLIFLATNNGLNIIDKNKKTITVYNEADGLTSKNVKNLFVDNKNYLWIGTMNGFCVMNIETREIININTILRDKGINDGFSGVVFQDREGIYWLGYFVNGGLVKLDPNTGEVENYKYDENNPKSLIDNSIRTITEDEEGKIWIGTSNGLSILNKRTNKFDNFTTEHGLVNNTIYGIVFDDKNQPWFSSNGGITTYNEKSGKFINLSIVDGLQSNEFNGKAYLKTKDGELFFGGVNGMNSFYPDDLKINAHITNVVFDEFAVNGVSTSNINNRKFNHDNNNIKITVFLPNYKNIRGTKYYYMLEGAEDEWRITDNPEFLFSNLSPGYYTFRVKGMNSRGIITDESKVSFTIKRPIWISIPAILGYIYIILLIIANQKNKVKKLDALVDARTEELRKEMDKNKKLFDKVISLEKSKNSYFINLSHELRTPLNVLHTTEQLITTLNKNENLERKKLEYYLDILRRNNKRLLNLINNLIDISKLENGKYIINKKPVDIVYLVEEVALGLKDYVEDKGIEFIIDPEMEEKIVKCDPQDIERCVINLISNAVKFTPAGGTIKVLIEDLNDKVRIMVKDTGIGISEEYHDLIFNRFNQVVDINSEIKGGSGLGLTITKQIIDLHEGKIRVESKVGEGCTFIIDLPVE